MKEGKRNNQSPTTGKSRENSKGVHDEAHRRANPVILSTPILEQGINTGATRRSKLGVKTRKLSVFIGGKTVDRVGTPFGINQSKHRGINPPIILVNEQAQKIGVERLRNPLRFQGNTLGKTKTKDAQSHQLKMDLRATNRNYPGGTLIVGKKIFTFLCFRCSTKKSKT